MLKKLKYFFNIKLLLTDIDFDEPSIGQVNSSKVALEVKNKGNGGCIKCTTQGQSAISIWGETTHDRGGAGVIGISKNWIGVYGESKTSVAVRGKGTQKGSIGVWGETPADGGGAGVVGINNAAWLGVHGIARGEGGHGVLGETTHDRGGAGVIGISKNWIGVYGESKTSVAVQGKGTQKGSIGVWGETPADGGGAGVVGINNAAWLGVHGIARGEGGHGVLGETTHDRGGAGVIGISKNWIGVHGESQTSIGVYGRGPIAGFFEGEVQVTGDIKLLNAGDCAEDFDIAESELKNVEAGTVMVLTESGSLQSSYQEYDKKVAGIVSGARGYKPGIILDSQQLDDKKNKNKERLPIALMGKVYCKVDARQSSIEIGDLLTTSSTKGYAMKAEDPMKAFGAVIGKALGSIKQGMGMIPVLVALQ